MQRLMIDENVYHYVVTYMYLYLLHVKEYRENGRQGLKKTVSLIVYYGSMILILEHNMLQKVTYISQSSSFCELFRSPGDEACPKLF